MISLTHNSIFTPENINTSSESIVTIILRDQEFLTSKTSEIMIFEEDDLKWSDMIFSKKHFLGYLDNKPCFVACLEDSSSIGDEMMLSPLRSLLGLSLIHI